jgi:hypothetical protein
MCFLCKEHKKLGMIFIQKDFLLYNLTELSIALEIHLLEVKILKNAIELYLLKKFKKLDAVVGDAKCQVRASILLDMINEGDLNSIDLKQHYNNLDKIYFELKDFLEILKSNEHQKRKTILNKIIGLTVYDILQLCNWNYVIPHHLFFVGLSFFSSLSFEKALEISENYLGSSRLKKLWFSTKKQLSLISIDYEQALAKKYGNSEIQKILEFIQTKGFCSMTAVYPSFIPIWNKIKDKKQLILKNTFYLCRCGGLREITNELFQANENKKIEKIKLKKEQNDIVFVMENYLFAGSYNEFEKIYNFSLDQSIFDILDLKLCSCSKFLIISDIENFDEAVLANFAQDRQFTNDAEIPWAELGLENSGLKKEYDYLKTLPGYSLNDMSKFLITHIYASTLEQELEDQRQLLMKLGKK